MMGFAQSVDSERRRLLLLLPAFSVFAALFVVPLAFFVVISFWQKKSFAMVPAFVLDNYQRVAANYGDVLLFTLALALVTALICLVWGFLFAYAVRFRAGRFGDALIVVTLLTLFGGYLVKIYAWKSILGRDGILNQALIGLGLIGEPLDAFIYNANGIVITLTYFLLPFAVLPIYGSMRAIGDVTLEASRDLGAGPWTTMRKVVLPQCERGILVAFMFTFLISAGDYVTPRFVGGGAAMMGHFIETQFSVGFNWPMGSAMSFTVMAASLMAVLAFRGLLRMGLRP